MTRPLDTLDAASSPSVFRIGTFALIFDDAGRILIGLRRDANWWNLPGGGMEVGETVEQTVIREVREETGLEVEVERLVGVYSKPQKQEVVLTFLCRITGGTLLASSEENRENHYFPTDALPQNLLPKHRQRIEDALLHQQSAVLRTQSTSTEEDQGLTSEEE